MPRYLIIDGYNAINKISLFETEKDVSLEAMRMALIGILKSFMARKSLFDKVFIVFDSKEKRLGPRKDSYGDVGVFFATFDKDADSVIVDILRKAASSDKITVASDDNFVRNHAKAFSKDAISIKELENIIKLNKKRVRSKIKEKDLESEAIKDINEELKEYWGLD